LSSNGTNHAVIDHFESSGASCAVKTSILDWSRDGRRQRIKEAVGSDLDQLHITDYYPFIEDFENLLQKNEKLSNILKQFSIPVTQGNNVPYFDSFPDMLKQVINNAVSNAQKHPKGRRHPEIIKKLSTSLFIFSGPFAYNFLQQNLGLSLPSLCTVQSHGYSQYTIINEGEFRFDGLLEHIDRYKLSRIVSIGEDATRVISRVEYDSQTDRCVGFVLPINEEGLPIVNSYLATSYERIEEMFAGSAIAKYAYVYIAKLLDTTAHHFA